MARVVFFALLALLVASVSAFVAPGAAGRASTARHVQATQGVKDAMSTKIDYESELKKMETEAKDRMKKAFDEATTKSEAESKERWSSLEQNMKKAASDLGL